MPELADMMEMCRLCCVRNFKNLSIFEDHGNFQQIFLKINTCLPVKVSKEDNLPKKICHNCLSKLEGLYHFWNMAAATEKLFITWLTQCGMRVTECELSQETQSIPLHPPIKEEHVDPLEQTPDYVVQTQFSHINFQVPAGGREDPNETGEPPTKRTKRQAAIKAAQLVAQCEREDDDDIEDEDADDPVIETIVTKTEEDSEDNEGEENSHLPKFVAGEGSESPELTSTDADRGSDARNSNVAAAQKIICLAFTPRYLPPNTQAAILKMAMQTLERGANVNKAARVTDQCANVDKATNDAIEADDVVKSETEIQDYLDLQSDAPQDGPRPPLDDVRKYRCSRCPEVFSTKGLLCTHRYHTHVGKRHKCDMCPNLFYTPSALSKHKLSHRTEKNVRCGECSAAFKSTQQLKLHMDVHSGVLPFACTHCDKKYLRKQLLVEHINADHLNKKKKCTLCGKEFKRPCGLFYHLKTHEGDLRTYKCASCDSQFKTAYTLRAHIRRAHSDRKYMCDVCGKDVTSANSLQVHIRQHTGEKPFGCETCGKSFTSKNQLVNHIRVHTKEKPFACKLCDQRFTQQGSVAIHMKNMHLKQKSHKCVICGKAFQTKHSLKLHCKRHEKSPSQRRAQTDASLDTDKDCKC